MKRAHPCPDAGLEDVALERGVGGDNGVDRGQPGGEPLIAFLKQCFPALPSLKTGDRAETEGGHFPDPLVAEVDDGANDDQDQRAVLGSHLAGTIKRGEGFSRSSGHGENALASSPAPCPDGIPLIKTEIKAGRRAELLVPRAVAD